MVLLLWKKLEELYSLFNNMLIMNDIKKNNFILKEKLDKFSSYNLDELNKLYNVLDYRLKKTFFSKKHSQALLIVMSSIDKEVDKRKFIK